MLRRFGTVGWWGQSEKDNQADVAKTGFDAMMRSDGDVVSGTGTLSFQTARFSYDTQARQTRAVVAGELLTSCRELDPAAPPGLLQIKWACQKKG